MTEKGEKMSSFKYKNKSTSTIISSPLCIAQPSYVEELTGLSRELNTGTATLTRPVPNYYGTTYADTITFDIALFKENQEAFTIDEQRTINAWLTSPKLPDYVEFNICNSTPILYRGLFTDVRWVPGMKMVNVTFKNDSSYCWNFYRTFHQIRGSKEVTIVCNSDELEEYVYPVLTIEGAGKSDPVAIKSISDGGNTMKINAYDSLGITIDCQRCTVVDATTNGIVSYVDLGWSDVGNIYWLRLIPGLNTLEITGDVDVTISYYAPCKRLGGYA